MVQLLLDAGALLGESPRWSAQEQRLYWVDIESRKIHRTDPATVIDDVMILAQQVGCIAPRACGGMVAAPEDGCAPIDPRGHVPRPFAPASLVIHHATRSNHGPLHTPDTPRNQPLPRNTT